MTFLRLVFIIFYVLLNLIASAQSDSIKPLSNEVREQFLQKANQFRSEENFAAAILQLDTILANNPNDAPILIFKGDLYLQSNLFKEASKAYKRLLPLNYEKTITQINLSYALFMNHKPTKALSYAYKAWFEDSTNNNAIVNYFNALLWNIRTNEADSFLQSKDSLLTDAQKILLRARLSTTCGNYKKGLKLYDSLVRAYPEKYYVLEYSEVLLGKKEINFSTANMHLAKTLFTEKELNAYQEKVSAYKQFNVGTEMVYFKDIGQNTRIENSIWFQQNEHRIYRFRISAGTAKYTSRLNEKTITNFGHIQIEERWNLTWSGSSDLHFQKINSSNGNTYIGLTGQQTIKYQPNDRSMFGLTYNREILNYTASLLEKNIRSNNLGFISNIMLNGKTGFYCQGSAGFISDQNERYQFFGSLYHLFRTFPTIKSGINYSRVHCKDSLNVNYFSPNRYVNSEIFTEFNSSLPKLSKMYFHLQMAAGFQKIEQRKSESSIRLQAELSLRLKHFQTSLKYQTSNVAINSGTGYKFNWFTACILWKW